MAFTACDPEKGNEKISRNKWQWKHNNSQPMESSKSSSKRDVYSNAILPQETRETWIDNLNLQLKQLEKEKQNKTKQKTIISRGKEIIRSEQK